MPHASVLAGSMVTRFSKRGSTSPNMRSQKLASPRPEPARSPGRQRARRGRVDLQLDPIAAEEVDAVLGDVAEGAA